MKRTLSRLAAPLAAAAVAATSLIAPAATAGEVTAVEQAGGAPTATVTVGTYNPTPTYSPMWRSYIAQHPDRVKEVWAYSPSMDRNVPLFVITPRDNSVPRPIIYMLNGGDGGEGRANWVAQTDIVDFYLDKDVNVVIPMEGKFSYYTDWVEENETLGGKNKWETFLTKELPGPLQSALGASEQRALAGMSMSATSALLLAQHAPGFYDAIGSFSGCAETAQGLPLEYIRITLARGNATAEQMWGPVGSENWIYNDALINAEKLRGQTMYISNATGLAGPEDLWSSPYTQGDSSNVMVHVLNGGVIEAATNRCTHDLKARLDRAGIPADWNLRPVGTHSWGYWQQDLRGSWDTFSRAFGMA